MCVCASVCAAWSIYTLEPLTARSILLNQYADWSRERASTSLGDMLMLSYRLKLPHAMGGYESVWRPLWSHTLNDSAVSVVRLACCACDARAPVALQAYMTCAMHSTHNPHLPHIAACCMRTCRRKRPMPGPIASQ